VTADELEHALAFRDQESRVQIPSVDALEHGPRRVEYGPLVIPIAVPKDSDASTPTERPRSKLTRYVPAAYAVGGAALRSRLDPRLSAALSRVKAEQCCGALFLGPSGCGKSSAAAFAVLRWLDKHRPSAQWRKRIVWLDAIEATDAERRYKLGSGDPPALVDAYRAEWLVIDDIGMSTSPALVQLVMSRRYQDGLATIATSGLTREQLSEHIGAATVRRIVEFQGTKGLLVDCHRRGS
jgi:hypothetical protein